MSITATPTASQNFHKYLTGTLVGRTRPGVTEEPLFDLAARKENQRSTLQIVLPFPCLTNTRFSDTVDLHFSHFFCQLYQSQYQFTQS